MGTWEFELAAPPTEPRELALWLQHAAGFILFEDVRNAALANLPSDLGPSERAAARQAADDAVYGLMQVIDGVSGVLGSGDLAVELDIRVRLRRGHEAVEEIDLRAGDGMCMGFHMWLEGDFGTSPVVAGGGEDGGT